MTLLDKAKDATIAVGAGGRGFIVWPYRREWLPLVMTAAHCLPQLPDSDPGASGWERTYHNLLGPIGGPATIAAECLFVDPVTDIAVLAQPDNQSLYAEADAYEQFIVPRPAFRIAALTRRAPVRLLALDGSWQDCEATVSAGGQTMALINAHIVGGMSGSPIVDRATRAIGIVSLGSLTGDIEHTTQHGQPSLIADLPAWLLFDLLKPFTALPRVIAAQRRVSRESLRQSSRAARQAAKAQMVLGRLERAATKGGA